MADLMGIVDDDGAGYSIGPLEDSRTIGLRRGTGWVVTEHLTGFRNL